LPEFSDRQSWAGGGLADCGLSPPGRAL